MTECCILFKEVKQPARVFFFGEYMDLERSIDTSKLNNGNIVEAVVEHEDSRGQIVGEEELFRIRKRIGGKDVLMRTLILKNKRREIVVPVVDVLDGLHRSDQGLIRFIRVLSPKELMHELAAGK